MDRGVAAIITGSAAVGLALGYGAPLLANESRDAPSPGPFNMYQHGSTDGWHYFSHGGLFNSDQEYTYTQAFGGGNLDEAYWKFSYHGSVSGVAIYDSASGIMVDYAGYSAFGQSNSCVNQGAYANAAVTVLGSSYVDGSVRIQDSACIVRGYPIGADAMIVYF
jgi:hypothetical protein